MPERVDAAIQLRKQAERLRIIAYNGAARQQSSELVRIARQLDDEARKLEAAAIRDLGTEPSV